MPARNEADNIEGLLESLQRSEYDRFEVLVVDDRSTDETARLAESFVARDTRFRLVRGSELPAGWYGKPWACYQGYREASGSLLLFTDADTRHDPGLLGRAVGALQAAGADLVSLIPRQVCLTFWERVIMPQIGLMLALRFSPASVNRARRSRQVIANGQFILVRREHYEAVGTHYRVRDQVAEDLALAQAFWRTGATLHLAHAESLIQTRMYTSLRGLIEGWSKNLYLGSRASFPDNPFTGRFAPIGLLLGLLYWLVPPAWLALAGAGAVPGLEAALLATSLCTLFWTASCVALGIPPWYGLAFPLGALMSMYIIGRSIWRGSRAVEWRGRTYSHIEGRGRGLTDPTPAAGQLGQHQKTRTP